LPPAEEISNNLIQEAIIINVTKGKYSVSVVLGVEGLVQ